MLCWSWLQDIQILVNIWLKMLVPRRRVLSIISALKLIRTSFNFWHLSGLRLSFWLIWAHFFMQRPFGFRISFQTFNNECLEVIFQNVHTLTFLHHFLEIFVLLARLLTLNVRA